MVKNNDKFPYTAGYEKFRREHPVLSTVTSILGFVIDPKSAVPRLIAGKDPKKIEQALAGRVERVEPLMTPRQRRIATGLVLTTAAAIAVIPDSREWILDALSPTSKIVAGVPVQVEAKKEHMPNVKITNTDGSSGLYPISVEQCPGDVEEARVGKKVSPSFDKRVGLIAASCVEADIYVTGTLYDRLRVGGIYTFPGKPSENVPKNTATARG